MTDKELEECRTKRPLHTWDAWDWFDRWRDKLLNHIAWQSEEIKRLQLIVCEHDAQLEKTLQDLNTYMFGRI